MGARRVVHSQRTGLFGAVTVLSSRNKRVLARMERRLGLEAADAARRHREARAVLEAKRRRKPNKRAISGELMEDVLGAVWSAVWRRGA